MPKFKVGDLIIRVGADNGPIKVGRQYVVEKTCHGKTLRVEGHPGLDCSDDYFILASSKPVTKFLVMWSGDRTQMYDTLEFAKDAANGRPIFEVVAVHEAKTEYVRREY